MAQQTLSESLVQNSLYIVGKYEMYNKKQIAHFKDCLGNSLFHGDFIVMSGYYEGFRILFDDSFPLGEKWRVPYKREWGKIENIKLDARKIIEIQKYGKKANLLDILWYSLFPYQNETVVVLILFIISFIIAKGIS